MPASSPSKPITVQQDRFAYFIATGVSQEEAAVKANYSPTSARHNAHRLMANEGIQQAVERYKRELAESHEVTAEQIIRKLWQRASQDENLPASVSALRTLAEIKGLTAGRAGDLPDALTALLAGIARGLATQQASIPAGRQATHPAIELTARVTDSEEDAG